MALNSWIDFLRQRAQNITSGLGKDLNRFSFRGPDLIPRINNQVGRQANQFSQRFQQLQQNPNQIYNNPISRNVGGFVRNIPLGPFPNKVKTPTFGQAFDFFNPPQTPTQQRYISKIGRGGFTPDERLAGNQLLQGLLPQGGATRLGKGVLPKAYQALNHHWSATIGNAGKTFSRNELDNVVSKLIKEKPNSTNEVFRNQAIKISHYINAVKKGVKVNAPFGMASSSIRDQQGKLKAVGLPKNPALAGKLSPRINPGLATQGQTTRNTVRLNITGATEQQKLKSAITNSERIKNELSTRGKDAHIAGMKLNPQDLKLAEKYQEGIPINQLAQKAKNPKAFTNFMNKITNYYDFRLAADRAVGGQTPTRENYLRQIWDLSDPAKLKQFNDLATQRGVAQWKGFSNQPRVFKTYAEGEAAGFKRANPNIIGDLQTDYGQASHVISRQALKQGLSQAAPDKVSLEGMGVTPEGKSFINSNIPGLEGISYHPDIHKQLKGFEPPTMTDFFGKENQGKSLPQRFKDTGAVDTVLSLYDHASKPMKDFLLTLSFFHPLNVGLSYAGRALTSPIKGARGLTQATAAFFSEGATQKIAEGFKNKIIKGTDYSVFDAGLRSGVNMDRQLTPTGKNIITHLAHATFDRFIYTLKLNMVDMSFGSGKLNPESPQGRAVGQEINLIAGELNNHIMNINPNTMKWLSRGMLAPSFTASKYKLLGHAVSEGGPAGSLARQTVVGKSIVEGTIATVGTLLATGKFPNLQQLLTNYTVNPSIQTNLTNPKGSQLDIGLPTSYISEPAKPIAGLLKGDTAPLQQYGQSRLNPLLSGIQSAVTNKDFYGRPITNPDSTTPDILQKAGNIGVGKLPIGIQNVVSAFQGKQTPVQAAIGVAGLRTHISPNDPTQQFFNSGGTTTTERQVASYLKTQGAPDKEIKSAIYHYSARDRLDKLYTQFEYDTKKAPAFNQKFQEVAQKDPAVKMAYEDTSNYLKDNPNISEVQLTQFAKKALDFYNKRIDQQYLNPAQYVQDQKTAENMQNVLPKQQRILNKRLREGK